MYNKKTHLIICFFVSILLLSCDKMQDARVTFFVANAGDAGKWDYITVTIPGHPPQQFFTPERRNMALGECGSAAHSTTFYLIEGTYSYTANDGAWSGTFTVDPNDCKLLILKY